MHTPRPWWLIDTSKGWVIRSDRDDLATVHDVSGEYLDGDIVDVDKGNAVLMWAAPDLLEALIALLDRQGSVGLLAEWSANDINQQGRKELEDVLGPVMAAARAAITKAEGR